MATVAFEQGSGVDFGYDFTYRQSAFDLDSEANDDEFVEKFRTMCAKVIVGDMSCDPYAFNRVLFHLTNKCPERIGAVIYDVINTETQNIQKRLAQAIANDAFALRDIPQSYKRYMDNVDVLRRRMSSYIETLQASKKHNHYNILKLYSEILFYKNVLTSSQYTYNGENVGLYKHVNMLLDKETQNMGDLQGIIGIHREYTKKATDCNDDARKYFDVETDKEFLAYLSNSRPFMCEMVKFMHETLINGDGETKADELDEYARIVSAFNDRSTFMVYYGNYLSMRLLSIQGTSVDTEFRLLQLMCGEDDKAYNAMKRRLNDIEDSEKLSAVLSTISVQKTTDKFKKTGDKTEKVKFGTNHSMLALTEDNWGFLDDMELKAPLEAEEKIRTIEKFYTYMYTSNDKSCYRRWKMNHEMSHGVIEITYPSGVYKIKAHMPTLYILLTFNDNKQITPAELSHKLDTQPSVIGHYLRVLNDHGLIKVVSKNGTNDVNMIIELNDDFQSDEKNIRIVDEKAHIEIDTNISTEFLSVLESMATHLEKNGELTKQTLFNAMRDEKWKFTLTEKHLDEALEAGLKQDILQKIQRGGIIFYDLGGDLDDDEDEDELETTAPDATEDID